MRTCAEQERCIEDVCGKPEGWKPLGRPKHRLEENI
jgi:hypothetical protein